MWRIFRLKDLFFVIFSVKDKIELKIYFDGIKDKYYVTNENGVVFNFKEFNSLKLASVFCIKMNNIYKEKFEEIPMNIIKYMANL